MVVQRLPATRGDGIEDGQPRRVADLTNEHWNEVADLAEATQGFPDAVATDIVPAANTTYDLGGGPTEQWGVVYTQNVTGRASGNAAVYPGIIWEKQSAVGGAVVDDDNLGGIDVFGSDGDEQTFAGGIYFAVDGTPGEDDVPVRLEIWTNPSAVAWAFLSDGSLRQGASGPIILAGSGSPEGAVTAVVGSMYMRTDGGANTTLYVKESGSGNTGWAAM